SESDTLSLHDALPIWNVVDATVDILDEMCTSDRVPSNCGDVVWTAVTQIVQCSLPWNELNQETLATIDGVLMASLNDSSGKATRSEEHTSELQSRENL